MQQSATHTARAPYGILAVLMIGAFIAFLNNTLLNIALPSIMKDLAIEPSTAQWLSTGFMLVNGVLIPTSAFLIQKYSVRRLFLLAMTLFSAGTILAGFAEVFPVLLAGRMIQASGSAIMMPLLMNVMLVSFPIEKRGTAMGFFGLIMMGAPAIGPTLSGWIIEHYDWRMLFHFITPIALIVLVAGFFLLRDVKERSATRIDLASVALSSLGFGGLLYGFSSAGSKGWDSFHVYGALIVGVIALVTFIYPSAPYGTSDAQLQDLSLPDVCLVFCHLDGRHDGDVLGHVIASDLCPDDSRYLTTRCGSHAITGCHLDGRHVTDQRETV